MKFEAHLECELFPREITTVAKFIQCPGHVYREDGFKLVRKHTAPVVPVEESE